MPQMAIETSGLTKTFGPVEAVNDLSISVREGSIFGLVGPDGGGKTTTMRMLCGIMQPDHGSASVAGYDVVRAPESVKHHIGYLPQRFSLHRDLSVDENVAYTADLYTVPRELWRERREELLEMTFLKPFRTRLAGRLSGGMRQKLALVCALIHRPEVLFLDEPTTGVDPVSRRDFWKILYDLPRQGVTIIISTPYMDEAAHCSRMAFMHHGRLLAEDTPNALCASLKITVARVRCSPQRQAREHLKSLPNIASVEVFGTYLHVAAAGEIDPAGLAASLVEAGVECHDVSIVEPSLEDVFVHLSGQHEAPVRPEVESP